MSDDLVKILRADDGDWRTDQAADRIEQLAATNEELEAKLASAEDIIHIVASDKWGERIGEAVDLSCEYLAELKGQEDGS